MDTHDRSVRNALSNDKALESEEFLQGAISMLGYLIRASRPHGFRVVTSATDDKKTEAFSALLLGFSASLEPHIPNALAVLLPAILNVNDPAALYGDILPAITSPGRK